MRQRFEGKASEDSFRPAFLKLSNVFPHEAELAQSACPFGLPADGGRDDLRRIDSAVYMDNAAEARASPRELNSSILPPPQPYCARGTQLLIPRKGHRTTKVARQFMGVADSSLFKMSGFLPKTRIFDYGFALAQFVQAHRRLPRISGGGLNDALFHIKTSKEMLDPLRAFVSDKARVKEYVKAKVGDAHNVPTIAVLESYGEVLEFAYPTDCVIKPTHMSGEIIFRRAGSAIDFGKVRSWFDKDFYCVTREVNYRHLRPRVIVEPYIFGRQSVEDYKVFCLHGRPFIVQVDFDRHTNHTQNLYTTDWELLPFAMSNPMGPGKSKPANLNELISIATKLSEEFNLIRIDLYTDERTVLVGEITNCHQAGRGRFLPAEGEEIMTRILFGEAGFSRSELSRLKPRTVRQAALTPQFDTAQRV